ncbi:MAG: transglutaminase domain-containing protein [Thermoflexaceae bacterium]|nr:transglutaminase domain-containing protein [Thermoflexaceae bacterium]
MQKIVSKMKMLSGGFLLVCCLLVCNVTNVWAEDMTEDDEAKKCGLKPLLIEEFKEEDLDNTILIEAGEGLPRKYSNVDVEYWTKFSSSYYYEQLSDSLKNTWDQLETACILSVVSTTDCESISASINMNGLTSSDIANFMYMFKLSNPQYYFLSNRVFYGSESSGYYVGIRLYDEFKDGDARKKITDSYSAIIDNWLTQVQAAEKPEAKVKLAHDLVAKNTEYGYSTYDQSSYSMVCEGTTVCAGYAAVFQMLLNASGIETAEVTSISHAWNIVKIHGYWYNVDVTWDDQGYVIYKYYNKSDTTFRDSTTSHNPESLWDGYLPEMKYDSSIAVYTAYNPAYFSKDGYCYFIVNNNAALADCYVKAVEIEEAGAVIPAVVDYNEQKYIVVNAESTSEAVNGLCKDEDGIWHYYRNGMIDTTYVGMAMNEEGWWYVRNGKIDFTFTGMAQNEYGWWYFRNGQLDFSYTGMAYNEYGWWYFRNGTIDWTYTGMAYNEYGWWYYRNGTIDWTYTGMAYNEYGWWYYRNGTIDWTYTGMACNEYGWWYYRNGTIDWTYTGMACNEYGWWYFNNGTIDWNYTGWAQNEYGWWYFRNGQIDFSVAA